MATYPNLDFQNFYETTLSNDLAIGGTDVFLTIVPTPTEGFLTIDPEGANPEIIWYSSKTSSKVVCPVSGRGFDGTTAQAWTSGTKVIMAPVAETQRQINNAASALTTTVTSGWITPSQTVGAVTYNGNRSYTLTMSADVSATLSPGMRIRTTRTVSAPTQCTSLNGTTQYYSRASASVTGMTFTDDFTVSSWIKITDYPSTARIIVSRYNGVSGWYLTIQANGTIQLVGLNGSASNYSLVQSYQSIPLNKWIHIAGQLDMSSFTATTTTSYLMFDGLDVPASVLRAGTNPTALVQAGNLEIGSYNGGTLPFPGKIAQVAIFNAKVTQATIRGYISQGLAGTETSLISAYSFNNSINDLNTTNANNLTANGSAVATNADSPFGNQASSTISSTLDYAIITAVSTNTLTVRTPIGNTIPTTGGVSAMSYSTQKAPYGMSVERSVWKIPYELLFWQNATGVFTPYVSGDVFITAASDSHNTTGAAAQLTVNCGSLSKMFALNAQTTDSGSAAARSRNSSAYFKNAVAGTSYTAVVAAASGSIDWNTFTSFVIEVIPSIDGDAYL